MNTRKWLLVGLISIFTILVLTAGRGDDRSDLNQVRRATKRFHRIPEAQAAGYDLVPGLDYCFENPPEGGMGFHYINTGILDTTVEMLKPEAMVYEPLTDGRLKLAAVEYIVPAAAWDGEGHSQLPQLFGHTFHLNESLGVYVLHAWIWKPNPSGMFADWNPRVSCP